MTANAVFPPRAAAAIVFFLMLSSTAARAQDPSAQKEPAPPAPSFIVSVEGKGPPMILIPGLTCPGEVWQDTVAHFRDRYECHVLSLAGFAGRPSIPPPFLETVRKDIAAYIARKKLARPVIVGHSLGGFLTYWLGVKEPDLVGPLIAVDGVPFYSALQDPNVTAEAMKPMAEAMAARARTLQGPAQREQGQRMIAAAMVTDPKNQETVVKWGLASDSAAVAQAMGELITTDLRGEVKGIRSPTLLLGALGAAPGPEFVSVMKAAYEVQVAAIPDHTLRFSDTAKHFIMFDEPEWMWMEMDAFLEAAKKK